MILVFLNQLQFEYDILSLVKAFYPSSVIKIMGLEDEESAQWKESLYNKKSKNDIRQEEAIELVIDLRFLKSEIQGIISGVDQFQQNTSKQYVVSLEENEQRFQVKNYLKRLLYDMLTVETDKILPWGTLTGIRPTKILMKLRESGMDNEEIRRHMKETYYLSEDKIVLCLGIIATEEEILSSIHEKDGYSLYIGIPFCPTTCLYCSFTSYPRQRFEQHISKYLEALMKELDFVKEVYSHKIMDTIYIGGGTPTTLTAQELEWLLEKITTTFSMDTVQEFTVEAGRADSITRDKLEVLYRYGVNRISVNPQTMKEETLQIIGRHHTIEQVKEVFYLAREVGFTNINMDLILGLPEETVEDVANTMKEIMVLQPDSITMHSLAIKRAARLSAWVEEHGTDSIRNSIEAMGLVQEASKQMQMQPYYLYRQKNMAGNFENIGYARSGAYGIYNIIIMEEKQNIMAVGAGSISKVIAKDGSMKRCDCVKDVEMYIDQIDEMIERKRRLLQWE